MTDITQDKKIDKLQFQMDSVLETLKGIIENQKETNARLEIMQKGFVERQEFKDFQQLVGLLASNKDLVATEAKLLEKIDVLTKKVESLQSWQDWAIRLILGSLITGGGLLTWLIKR